MKDLVARFAGAEAERVRHYRHLGYPAVRFSTRPAKVGYLQHHLIVLDEKTLLRVQAFNDLGVTIADADLIRDRFQPLHDRAKQTPVGWTEHTFLTGKPPDPAMPPGYDPGAYGVRRGFKEYVVDMAKLSPAARAAGDIQAAKNKAEREAKLGAKVAFPARPEVTDATPKANAPAGVEWFSTVKCQVGKDQCVLRLGYWRNPQDPSKLPKAPEVVETVGRQAAEVAAGPRGTIDLFRRTLFGRVDPKDKNTLNFFANLDDPKSGAVFGREYRVTQEDDTMLRGVVYSRNGTVIHLEHRGPTEALARAFFDSVR